ncbi:urease accessory protein UreE [Microbulbifer sp. CAU 1566]|uniref:urease accessory protein UreE n=1 Tax=Microbulbifer sp. CAU 1566 TaxID=2933269 RepID=UPI002005F529|nr:urease accessory protein UreE [Microbulbifer sp. CAU 1566]MCK7596346.1 urease accessory protein UreE [Microbulbifer sp. CAU 1566]
MTLDIYERLGTDSGKTPQYSLVLDHLQRDRGRLRAQATDGSEVRIFLERGKPLQVGEILQSQCDSYVEVVGAEEPVTTAHCNDWFTFSRACYHLGNRHVKLQIGNRESANGYWLRITPDHVLEEMLELLGLSLMREEAVFVPESGAYSGGHSHGHSQGHSHGHSHNHSHSHDDHHEHHHH